MSYEAALKAKHTLKTLLAFKQRLDERHHPWTDAERKLYDERVEYFRAYKKRAAGVKRPKEHV